MDLYYIIAIILFLLAVPKFIGFVVHFYLYWRKRSEKNSLSEQILAYRNELRNISQVNEFAKYSKIQRKLKILEQQYHDHMRRDLELKLTYVAIGKGLSYLLTVIFGIVLVYKLLSISIGYISVGNEVTSN
jgi:biopolymer transport protein ExbB/TolQ